MQNRQAIYYKEDLMSHYRIPFILFAGIVSTVLILLSCGQDSSQVASTQAGEARLPGKHLQESGITIKNLQRKNRQLKKELLAVTKELVRVKVERDVLRLELGPKRHKTGMTKTDQADKP